MERMVTVKATFDGSQDSINNVETVLKRFNITLRDSTGEFLPLGQVIDDVGKRWKTFGVTQQDQISTAVNKTAATHSNVWINYNLDIDKNNIFVL
jgi:hypothetical protein